MNVSRKPLSNSNSVSQESPAPKENSALKEYQSSKRLTIGKKLATTAGVLAALGATNLEGDVLIVDDRPVSGAATDGQGSSVGWDVDGNGSIEFELFTRSDFYSSNSYSSSMNFFNRYNFYGILRFASNAYYGGQLNGRGLVGPGGAGASALPNSFNVGPTLATGYQWGATDVSFRNALRTDFYSYQNQAGTTATGGYNVGVDFVNFEQGTNYLGFRFDNAGNLHYGWAEIEISGSAMTISRWAYESDAGTGIQVEGVPEPCSLVLLGLGASGILAMRRRRESV